MNIAVITGRGFKTFGGIETYVEEIYTRLAARGHKIIIYTPKNGLSLNNSNHGVENCELPFVNIPHFEIFSHCLLSCFHVWLRNPDIVCYHGSIAAMTSCLPVRRGSKKVVIFHGLDWANPMLKGFLRLGVYAGEFISSRFSDRLIVVSKYLQRYFETKYNANAICISPGIRQYNLRPSQDILKWGLIKENYILFLGRLTPEKGCHLLIQAYRSVDTEMKLVLAGPTLFKYKDKYYNYLRRLAIGDPRIIFTGLVEGKMKEELLSNAYLVVYPSLIGGLPLTILEAMGYRRCTLTSAVCDYYQIIKDYSVLFKTGDERDLAKKLYLLIKDPSERKKPESVLQKYINAGFSWQDAALKFEKIFEEVMTNGY